VRVPSELLGKKVKCPGCAGTFVAQDPAVAPPASSNKQVNLQLELDEKPKPPPPPDFEEMEEISPEPMKPRPVKAKPVKAHDDGKEPCPYCGELIKSDATHCKYCGEDLDEEDEEDRPSQRGKKKKRRRREYEREAPHRGGLVMTLGLVSLCLIAVDGLCSCCGGALGMFISTGISAVGLGLGIPAWVMGQKDLKRMRSGEMDERGRGNTQTGYICGMVGTILHGLSVVCGGIVLIFVVAMQGVSLMSTSSGFGGSPPNQPGQPGRRFEAPLDVPRWQSSVPDRNLRFPAPTAP
jgi:hypothetical protein